MLLEDPGQCDGLQLIKMRKRQELQEYLDEQLERIDQQHPPPNSFDRLEQKLTQIEKKLLFLKNHHYPQPQSYIHSLTAQQNHSSSHKRSKKEVGCETDEHLRPHQFIRHEFNKVEEVQKTPQKLNIISKTMSQDQFQFKSNKNHPEQQIQQKKDRSETKTAKNKQLKNNQKNNSPILKQSLYSTAKKSIKGPFREPTSSSKKARPESSNQKNPLHSQMIHLKKDIQECMRSNAQLRVKVSQLEGYKIQFCKLKEIICKFDKQRNRNK